MMSGRDHKHPTWGVCECGHLAFMHEWTVGQRVDWQADCTADVPDRLPWKDEQGNLVQVRRRCECERFHADRRDNA